MQLKFAFLVFILSLTSYSTCAESLDKLASAEPAENEVSISGFTRAHATLPVVSEVSGKIKEVFAHIGEPIPPNGKLACLDDIFVRLDLQSADNEIAQHNNDVNYYIKEVSRHEQLVAKKTTAISVLDSLNRDLINSQRALQAASIRKQRLNESKRRHCIEAPPGWLVINRSIEKGQWVNEGEVIAQIGDYSKLIVPITLTPGELASLSKKDKIEILLTEHNFKVPATIEHISPAFDENTRKIPVDLSLKAGLPEYRGGIRVELSLGLPGDDHTFLISQNALQQRFEENWLQHKDGKSIRVDLLSQEKYGKVKIKSAEVKAGDQFKIFRN